MFKKHIKLFSVILTVLFLATVSCCLFLRQDPAHHPGISLSELSPETRSPGIVDGKVDINHADAEILQLIPGIGVALSARIVEYRNNNGPFHSTRDLLRIHGIGEGIYRNISPYITIGGIS